MMARGLNCGWHTKRVFALGRPTEEQIARQIEAARGSPPHGAVLVSIDGADREQARVRGLAHDRTKSCLGSGAGVFAAAKRAFERWEQFDLGWARAANPLAAIALGAIIAVEVRSLGL